MGTDTWQNFTVYKRKKQQICPFTVSVVNSEEIVGHVPQRISAACALFLQHHGLIRCEVTGDRRHFSDLPQGGLEVPCDLGQFLSIQ